jgi:hypothetical protein
MDELAPVIRQFRRILPNPTRLLNDVTLRELRVWLRDDVGKLVDGLARRPAFREGATWPLHVLGRDSKSVERKVVDNLETALLNAAKTCTKMLGNKRVYSQLTKSFPPRQLIVGESIEIGGTEEPKVLSRQSGLFDELELEASQIRCLAKQDAKALALINLGDYFEPRQEFVRTAEGERIQVGTHIVSMTPELHPVGNLILQSADRRLEVHLQLLTSIRRKIGRATRELGRAYRDQEASQAAWEELQKHVKLFRRTFQSGPKNAIRNACITLTQIYAAFHPAPDLEWLGMPENAVEEARGILQQRIHGYRGGELFERINDALIEVRGIYDDSDSAASVREQAIANGDLVVIKAERVVWWDCKAVSFSTPSSRAAWDVLVPLVTKARFGGFISEQDVFGEKVTGRSGMPMRIQRLKLKLPISLRKLIIPGPEARSYRLDLERRRIHLI